MAKGNRPAAQDMQAFKQKFGGSPISVGVSLKRVNEPFLCFYVHTHRARSDCYSSVNAIPASVVKWIESTG